MSRRTRTLILMSASAVAVSILVAAPARAAATTYYGSPSLTGDCLTPATACSLATAISLATDGDTIQLATGEYDGPHTITHGITLTSAPGSHAILDGGGTATILTLNTANEVDLTGLTIQNAGTSHDGVVDNGTGDVTVRRSTFVSDAVGLSVEGAGTIRVISSNFHAITGTGLNADGGGDVIVAASTFRNVASYGIAFTHPSSSLTVSYSTFSDGIFGIAAISTNASVDVSDSTFSGASGVGIDVNDGATTVYDSTFVNNSEAIAAPSVDVTSSTITGNEVGLVGNGSWTVGATIVAGNTTDCSNAQGTDEGFNIDSDGSCGLSGTGSISNSATIADSLEPLGANGGVTETMALKPGSQAVARVTDTLTNGFQVCGGQDERGELRPDTTCDVGAFELPPPRPSSFSLAVSPSRASVGQSVKLTASVLGTPNFSPTGHVKFTVNGNSIVASCDQATVSPTSLGYTASCTTTKLAAGVYHLKARYTGDAEFQPATDSVTPFEVSQGATTTKVSGKSSAKAGRKVTLTVTTAHHGGPALTGSVTVYDNGVKVAAVAEKPAGTVTVAVKVKRGKNTLQARYSGDPNYLGSAGTKVVTGKR